MGVRWSESDEEGWRNLVGEGGNPLSFPHHPHGLDPRLLEHLIIPVYVAWLHTVKQSVHRRVVRGL